MSQVKAETDVSRVSPAFRREQLIPFDIRWYFPCRRCARCRSNAQVMWTERALSEMSMARRSWLFTGTFDWKQTSEGSDPLAHALRSTTLAFKKLRKAGFQVRYMAVLELHPGDGLSHGLPHVHALIHDVGDGPVLQRRPLQHAWSYGYSKANLIGSTLEACEDSARYVCKYLVKSERPSRVRASLLYGKSARQGSTLRSHL